MRLKCFKFLAIILIMISAVLPGFTQEKIEVELGQKKMSEGKSNRIYGFRSRGYRDGFGAKSMERFCKPRVDY